MSEQVVKISDSWATPGALGLTGFSLSTIVLAFLNLGLAEDAVPLIAMSIFVGGIAQFCAGLMAFKKGSTFDMVAFCGFGSFWLSFAYILLTGAGSMATGLYLIVWALLAFALTLGVIKLKAKALIGVLGLLTIVLIVSGLNAIIAADLAMIAGVLCIVLGLLAFYTAMAIVLNEVGFKLPL
ncbi:MAG: acetate uptake transporter [Methanimicrococcus sp.]|nr:acetate uptake transporter [Methanimicrococcus sp.]